MAAQRPKGPSLQRIKDQKIITIKNLNRNKKDNKDRNLKHNFMKLTRKGHFKLFNTKSLV